MIRYLVVGIIMEIAVLTLLIGFVAGLRAMVAPAAASWGAALGWLPVQDTSLSFMTGVTPYVITGLAFVELLADKMLQTPRRTTLLPLAIRLAAGAWAGATLMAAADALIPGLLLGALGAAAGAFIGAAFRRGRPPASPATRAPASRSNAPPPRR